MENKFLAKNYLIKEAIRAAYEEMNQETITAVVEAIQKCMLSDGHFLVPVEGDLDSGEDGWNMRMVPTKNGLNCVAAFTDEEELEKGQKTAVISFFMDVFLQSIVKSKGCDGVLINPWGEDFYLPKSLIQMVLEAVEDDVSAEDNAELLEKAIHFATDRHAGQFRKGTTTPYILHPLETMEILHSMGADTRLMVAGVLHDTIEDTDTTSMEIIEEFGTDVAALVDCHSEDKSKSWEERKQKTIEELGNASIRLKMLVMADKLSNLRSMMRSYRQVGEELWQRFNAPKDMQAWYYGGIQDQLWVLQNIEETAQAYWEMVGLYKDLFVGYYVDEEQECIYQMAADGECYYLKRGDSKWYEVECPETDGLVRVEREYAERMEDVWGYE